jgi:hypothetical protein
MVSQKVPFTPFDVGPKGSALRAGFDTLVASGAANERRWFAEGR